MSVSAEDYRADIDGFRAVAILLVAVFRFKLFPLGDAGFIGVDVFFVISGFLITRILAAPRSAGRAHRSGGPRADRDRALWAAWQQTDGFLGRFSPEVREVLAYSGDRPWKFMGCEVTKGNTEPCELGTKSGPLSVVVIGDSHAQAMAGALDLWFEGRGQNAALWFHHGCLPVLEAEDFRCQEFLGNALAAAETEGVETVYFASAWRNDPGVFQGRYLTGEEADKGFRAALDATLARLRGAGREVVLIDPVFHARQPVPAALARNLHFGTDRPVDTSYDYYLAVNSRVFAIFDEAVRTHGVRRISLIGELCEGGTCRATLDGSPVFSDSNHIRFGMSPYFAGVLERLELSD